MDARDKKVAVIGGGVIGAGWVARYAENGINVTVFDPAPDAELKAAVILKNADLAYSKLAAVPRLKKGRIQFAASIGAAVSDADLITEAVPEDTAIKAAVYAEIEESAESSALIASSTSGLLPSTLQKGMRHPERLFVAHPFNPVYLLPLVELVAGKETDSHIIPRASKFYKAIGMRPLHVKKEIEAFVADRLLEAVWRESLWLVKDGIATTEEIDDAIRFGFGLRWAQMGIFETYRLAGGDAGMRHFMEQFGPTLEWPWSKLTDVPEFNDELVELISSQSDAQSGHHSIRDLARIRDDNLIGILKALRDNNWGAGETLAEYEKNRLKDTVKLL
jgi:carnitine 3-dehydrogenase